MIGFSAPLLLFLLVPLVVVTLFAWRKGYANLSEGRMRVALAIRLAILAALVFGLAGMSLRLPQSRQAVVFVTDLSASDAGQRTSMAALINAAAAQRPSADGIGVIDVGRQPVVEQPVSGLGSFGGFQSAVDPRYTNLEGGLDLANALLPSNTQRRVVVISDGQQNVGDAVASARLLHDQGVRVDVVPAHVPSGPEVLVDAVDAPAQLRAHERFALTVVVKSNVATTTGITVFRDRAVIGSRQVRVRPGENRFVFSQDPLPPGLYSYQVDITPARDTQPENNQGTAFTSVAGPPRVLVIAQQPREAAAVVASLQSTGIVPELRRPSAVTPTLAFLQRYSAIVLVDTSADDLGPLLLNQIVPFVRDLGRGLVVLGGEQAYSMGGYGGTPLEQALPVRMDLPKRTHIPTVAVVLIIESLEATTPINISKVAGEGVVDLLTPQDQVAVNDAPYDGSAGWVVPLQHVTNKAAISGAIDRMQPGDPDSYVPYLQEAATVLQHAHAEIKHIVLLGDGDAVDTTYQQVAQQIRAEGITISTVATNGEGRNDFQTMQDIARWGRGRYYKADDPAAVPNIFLREARTVSRSGIVEGKFYPQQLSDNPMLRDVHKVAPLYGYVATTPKPAGEIVLASKTLDPILAAWQYGSGRAVAWTSDAAGLWTRDWLAAPGANRFWANLVSWTLPAAGTGSLFISASNSEGQGRISVTLPSSLGPSPDVTAQVLEPNRHVGAVQLEPSAPGEFGGSFPASSQGAYFVTVLARGAGHAATGQVGLDVPYSAEYATTGDNMTFLHALAAAGGGELITKPGAVWRDNLAPVLARYTLTVWLWLLALLLLPVDIGVRRLVLGRRELNAVLAALPLHSPSRMPQQATVAPLETVRARRRQRVPIRAQPERREVAAPVTAGVAAGPAPPPTVHGAARPASERVGSRSVVAARPVRTATTQPSSNRQPVAEPQSTTSQLLAAKRRRRAGADTDRT